MLERSFLQTWFYLLTKQKQVYLIDNQAHKVKSGGVTIGKGGLM